MKLIKIESQQNYIIKGARIWDGSSPMLSQNRYILVEHGHITKLVPHLDGTDQKFTVMDCGDLTLLPGLVDCHVHLAFDSENLLRTINEWSTNPEATWVRLQRWLADSLSWGITTLRDGGDLHGFNLRARDNILNGQLTGPNIISTGKAIYKKGKYGNFLGPGITSYAEAAEQIQQLTQQNTNQLKVVVSGLVSFKDYGVVGKPQFSVDELKPIVELAHQSGLPVMAHASSDEAVRICIESGVDSVEHGYFISENALKMMADLSISWVPTVAPLGNLVKLGHLPYGGARLDVIKRTYEGQLTAINRAAELGVLLGVGTDAGANHVLHGYSFHEELAYYQAAGLSPYQVLRCATSNGAKITGADKCGLLQPGFAPFLIGVEGDPLKDLKGLQQVQLVVTKEQGH